jgi:hypothetical protein
MTGVAPWCMIRRRIGPLESSLHSRKGRRASGAEESVWQRSDATIPWQFSRQLRRLPKLAGPTAVGLRLMVQRSGGSIRHSRVRFSAVVASANSAATFDNPRSRYRRMPRCSFSTREETAVRAGLLRAHHTRALPVPPAAATILCRCFLHRTMHEEAKVSFPQHLSHTRR